MWRLINSRKNREEMIKNMKEAEERQKKQSGGKRGMGGAFFGDAFLPPIESADELERSGCDTWMEVMRAEKDGAAYVHLMFRARDNMLSSAELYLLGDKVVDIKELYRNFGDDDDDGGEPLPFGDA